MSNKNLRILGIAVFDTGIAMVIYYSLNGFIGNYPAAAVMVLALGAILFIQGMEHEDETPEERILGDTDE